jgi:predicted Zn-dependent protease
MGRKEVCVSIPVAWFLIAAWAAVVALIGWNLSLSVANHELRRQRDAFARALMVQVNGHAPTSPPAQAGIHGFVTRPPGLYQTETP